jgi:hypothetical protein
MLFGNTGYFLYYSYWGESRGTAATTGLLYQPQMIGDGDCEEKLVKRGLAGETEVLGENLPQHHKSHMTRPGFEPGPPRWEASDFPLELWRGLNTG